MKRRVIIVEDDERLRERMVGAFDLSGCETTLASDGLALGLLLEATSFDALVLDLDLHTGRAWDVLADLISLKPTLRVILISGTPSRLDIAHTVGADAVVGKPVDLDALLRTTHTLLDSGTSGREPSSIVAEPSWTEPEHFYRENFLYRHWLRNHGREGIQSEWEPQFSPLND